MKKILIGLSLMSCVAYAAIQFGDLTVKGNLNVSGTPTLGSTAYPGTFATGDIIYATSPNTLAKLTAGTSGKPLVQGASTPSWATLGVSGGGTGLATITAHGVLIGEGTSAVAATSAGSAGQILLSGGSSADPVWSTPTYPSASGSAGKILRADGTNNVYSTATFPDTATAGSILNASGSNVWTSTVTPTLGVAGSSTGTLSLTGSTSGTIVIKPQPAAGSYNFILPITVGLAGQVLTTQGGGSTAMTWTSALTNPMTTTGDILYSTDNSGTPGRLGIGSTNNTLRVISGIPAWQSIKPTVSVKTSGSSATYTPPATATFLKVTVVGGGGGGGGAGTAASSGGAGGGGGGGGTVVSYISSISSAYVYTVGGGGSAGTSGANAGGDGVDSTFTDTGVGGTLTLTGSGGKAGGAGTARNSGTTSGSGGAGGNATGGNVLSPGGPGGTGIVFGAGVQAMAGSGGNSRFGGGGLGQQNANAAGIAGSTYGGGGSGGVENNAGGNQSGALGGAGVIIIEEFYD